ncbi:MAG: hypothetical protein JSU61_05610 [Fidelibacterota bacterium]|nr:MAG: hypothetical protein JSU61_05610 [Candidatus Neomarinimicrobiota bacterium]
MSTPATRQIRFPFIHTLLVGIITTVMVGSTGWAAAPEIVLKGAMVYPRSDITTNEELVWQSQLTIRHRIGSRFSWYLLSDATPATLTRAAGARIYSGHVQFKLSPTWKITAGRQVQWNTLHTSRFDGISISRRKGSFRDSRQLSLYVGLSPDDEVRTDYGDAGTLVAGGILKRTLGSTHYSVQAWMNEMDNNSRAFVGGSLRRRFGDRLTQVADLAFDLQQSALEKVRLRTQIRLSTKISTHVQYRYAGHLTVSPYPWIDKPLDPRHAISAGMTLTPWQGLQLRMNLVQRLGENASRYLSTQFRLGPVQFAWQLQDQTLCRGQHLELSAQHTLFGSTLVGGSVGSGTYALYDTKSPAVADLYLDEEERSLFATKGWLQGTLGKHLTYRLFGQYAKNRYFKQDGRFGLQVSYAL